MVSLDANACVVQAFASLGICLPEKYKPHHDATVNQIAEAWHTYCLDNNINY